MAAVVLSAMLSTSSIAISQEADRVIEAAGSVSLFVDRDTGQYTLRDETAVIGITWFGDPFVGDPNAEWSMIQAEDNTAGGYDLLFLGSDGEFWNWTVDDTGEFLSDFPMGEILDAERFYEADLNGDGTIGIADEVVEAIGSVSLLVDGETRQYMLQDGDSEIPITVGGGPGLAVNNSPWSAVHGEDTADGDYLLLFRHSDGNYAGWVVDATGARTSNFDVGDVREVETLFEADINGDGTIGAPVQVIDPASDYNPRPFLVALVEYRQLAYSCEVVLPGSPVEDSSSIDQYFTALSQNAPRGSSEEMDRIVNRLIRSQAASICTERLQNMALTYGRLAAAYESQRPDGWPPAPVISAGPWCSTPTCSNLR